MFEILKRNFAKAKKEPEPKQEPISDHDLNLIMLMKNLAQSDYTLGKITDKEYVDHLANIEIIGLKMAERRINELEEATHGKRADSVNA